jgi:hypothetical protein
MKKRSASADGAASIRSGTEWTALVLRSLGAACTSDAAVACLLVAANAAAKAQSHAESLIFYHRTALH